MKKKINIFWFREDLRLVDNAGFYHAASDCSVLPIYILDLVSNKEHLIGGASKVWLHESLKILNNKLHHNMLFFAGDPKEIIKKLVAEYNPEGFLLE